MQMGRRRGQASAARAGSRVCRPFLREGFKGWRANPAGELIGDDERWFPLGWAIRPGRSGRGWNKAGCCVHRVAAAKAAATRAKIRSASD